MGEKSTHNVLKDHMVFQKTNTTSLTDVRMLNMWGYELSDVSIVEEMRNIETIVLSINNISTLRYFASCHNLKSLFLRRNNICDLNEIKHLRGLRNLKNLMLSENPVASLPNYRSFVASVLPGLEVLDDEPLHGNVQNVAQRSAYDDDLYSPPRNQQNRSVQRDYNRQHNEVLKRSYNRGGRVQSVDDGMLTAVLALIPQLSDDSLQIVLDAIKNRNR